VESLQREMQQLLERTVRQDVRPWCKELNVGDATPDSVRDTGTLKHIHARDEAGARQADDCVSMVRTFCCRVSATDAAGAELWLVIVLSALRRTTAFQGMYMTSAAQPVSAASRQLLSAATPHSCS
jgi:hypothetical protein